MPRRPPKSRRGAYGTGSMKTTAGSYPQYWHITPQGVCHIQRIPVGCRVRRRMAIDPPVRARAAIETQVDGS